MEINCEHPTIIRIPDFNKKVMSGFTEIYKKGQLLYKLTYKNIQSAIKKEYVKIPAIRINNGFKLKNPQKFPKLPKHLKQITYTYTDEKGNIKLMQHNRDLYKRVYTIEYDQVKDFLLVNPETGEAIELFMQVSCNHCLLCNAQKRYKLATRSLLHYKQTESTPMFITLTYAQEPKDKYNLDLHTREIQLFNKRLRKNLEKYDFKYKYIFVSEYGDLRNRLHYHGLIFNVPEKLKKQVPVKRSIYGVDYLPLFSLIVNKSWKKGFVKVEEAKDKTGKYVAKYIGKSERQKTKVLKSIRLGKEVIEPLVDDLRDSPSTSKILIEIDGKIEKIPYFDWINDMVFPSLSKQLDKEFRDSIFKLECIFRKHDNYDLIYQILKGEYEQNYQCFARLLDFQDIEFENIKKNSIDVTETKPLLNKLKKYDYQIDKVTYINNQRNKHIQLTNVTKEIDTNLKAYLEEIYINQRRELETDGQ